MKNIERLLEKGDTAKVEKLRVEALQRQDAVTYTKLCNYLGIGKNSCEDGFLYDIGITDLSNSLPKEKPADFFDAWNNSKKVPSYSRQYQPGRDFAYANGKNAKKVLSGMFPSQSDEISKLNAKQAKKAYFDIRSVYFG